MAWIRGLREIRNQHYPKAMLVEITMTFSIFTKCIYFYAKMSAIKMNDEKMTLQGLQIFPKSQALIIF